MSRRWTATALAEASGATVIADPGGSASGFAIDSREVAPGELFIGIPGATVDGGSFAAPVIESGAFGALVTAPFVEGAVEAGGVVLEHPDPVAALGSIAAAHRSRLDCPVIGITGSSGKTSTKDILEAILSDAGRTLATRGNRNTEIGMPLEILRADEATDFLVLEMAMRGSGQIAELAAIARPTVGVIVSIGPAHLELLGSLEAIAAAKSELIAALEPGSGAVMPADERLLDPHFRDDLTTVTFGEGGDLQLAREDGRHLTVSRGGEEIEITVDFDQPHNRRNLLAALAAAGLVGVRPPSDLHVRFSSGRGERLVLEGDILVINDCYNANPASVAAGLADLERESSGRGERSVAVLGDMLELGPAEVEFHESIGAAAARAGVGFLITVGERSLATARGFGGSGVHFEDAASAALAVRELLQPGDTVLVKGSRSVGLEAVVKALGEAV